MTNQDMDFLARKIVSLENKHNALARARQLPNSSVRLIDGSDVSMRDSAESGSDNRAAIEQLEGATTDIGSITDTGAENAVSVPDWFNELGVGVDVAWDSTQFLTDLSLELEAELGQAQQDLAQAQLDVEQAMLDVAEALQEAQTAIQVAGDANTAASDAADVAAAAQTTAGNAQIAAGNAQDAADQAALDALAAANAASAAQDAADDAQTTANAKGKVIIQTATPNAADRLPQNLWIDTTGGANTPKRWSGSAWVAVTDKAATDAAAAAVAAQSTANTAYNEAVNAATAAGNAQTAANGKNTVWYQNDQPAGSGHKTGDTWFDTNDGNRVYRWNGAWTSTQFGTNAISDTAVNAAKLASNAVTEGKILNGSITNDKLNSAVQNAITTAQSTASNAQSVANSAQSAASAAQTAASNAQDDADQAILDAAAAAGIAGSKADVLIQSTAPPTAMRKATTLWIDTTGGANTPKRWVSGTTWAAVTDKAATDAAAAAATAQSAANAAHSRADDAHTIASGAATAASAAASAASAAQTAANNAQTTANGKNKIVRSTSDASSPGNYVAGDQWWKYSGSQITAMWIHSGSAWVSQTLTDSVITNLNAGSITAGTIASARLSATNIKAVLINAGAIETANIAAGAITAASGIIADAAIGTAKIIDGSITTAKIANLAVTNAEIANGTIQNAKIANLDAAKITTGTLNAARIASNSISADKMAANSITAVNGALENLVVTNAKLGNLAVTEGKIGNLAVTNAKIADLAVSEAKIIDLSVSTAKIANLAVTDAKIGSLSAEKITAGTINADRIGANSITATKISGGDFAGKTFTGGIFTGSTIRTAASGQRTQLDTIGLRTFNASGTETARIAADGSGLRLTGPLVSVDGSGTAAARFDVGIVELTSNLGTGWTDRTTLTAAGLSTNIDAGFYVGNDSNEAGTSASLYSGSGSSNRAGISVSVGSVGAPSVVTIDADNVLFKGDQLTAYDVIIDGYQSGWSPGAQFRWVKHGNLVHLEGAATADRQLLRITGSVVSFPLPFPALGVALDGGGFFLDVTTGTFYEMKIRLADVSTAVMEVVRADTVSARRVTLNQSGIPSGNFTRWRFSCSYLCQL